MSDPRIWQAQIDEVRRAVRALSHDHADVKGCTCPFPDDWERDYAATPDDRDNALCCDCNCPREDHADDGVSECATCLACQRFHMTELGEREWAARS